MSEPVDDERRPVHFLCLIHGMWGNPVHLAEAARVIGERAKKTLTRKEGSGVDFEMLVAESNRETSTYDGIDYGGERIAEEILAKVEAIESDGKRRVTRFSTLGYSLGGLLARYVVGTLEYRSFFTHVQPINFTTIATPHIGIPKFKSFWSRLSNTLGPRLLSRTGEQFYAVDKYGGKEWPLLEVMSHPGSIYVKGLKRFEQVRIYGNAVNDITVPYVTACIADTDPFAGHEASGIEVNFVPKYKPIIQSYTVPEIPPPAEPEPTMLTKEWFKSKRPPLPPFLQKRFPYSVLIYASIPILLPTFLMLAIIRLSRDTRQSRERIKLLDTSLGEGSARLELIKMWTTLEKEVLDAVADFVDESGTPPNELEYEGAGTMEGSSSSPTPNETRTSTPTPSRSLLRTSRAASPTPTPTPTSATYLSNKVVKKGQPTLKPSQQRMVSNLSTSLPHMQRYMAYIDPVRNSHATIISRDVANFEFHRIGEGVLRHWADAFTF